MEEKKQYFYHPEQPYTVLSRYGFTNKQTLKGVEIRKFRKVEWGNQILKQKFDLVFSKVKAFT